MYCSLWNGPKEEQLQHQPELMKIQISQKGDKNMEPQVFSSQVVIKYLAALSPAEGTYIEVMQLRLCIMLSFMFVPDFDIEE